MAAQTPVGARFELFLPEGQAPVQHEAPPKSAGLLGFPPRSQCQSRSRLATASIFRGFLHINGLETTLFGPFPDRLASIPLIPVAFEHSGR